jgi:TonB family protein
LSALAGAIIGVALLGPRGYTEPTSVKPLTLSIVVICVLVRTVGAENQEVGTVLNAKYGGRALHLRHFFKSNSQEYDAQGTPLQAGDEGPWTLYGGMTVKKISVSHNTVLIEGKRAAYVFDTAEKLPIPVTEKDRLRITIRLHAPLTTADEAVIVLERVFALTRDDILSSVPSPWQDYLKKYLTPNPSSDGAQTNDADSKGPPSTPDVIEAAKAFKVGEPGLTPPRILYKPEPEFTEEARKHKIKGVFGLTVLVETTGRIEKVSIVHPLGMGLDESAIESVKAWRFQPATKDGVPVAVAVYIEVEYHFYDKIPSR